MKIRELIKCDLLIIGGGIAGLEAAIAAAGVGTDVIVAEKANTLRSGCGANGNDHFLCYIPSEHGSDLDQAVREVGNTMDGGPWVDVSLTKAMLERTCEIVERWESYGINMRPTGKYVFEGHSIPGQQRYHLKFDGTKQKGALTKAAREAGARLENRVAINQLLIEDGRLVGAIGVYVGEEEPELLVFQAKAAIIAAGMAQRLYPQFNPAYMFNLAGCPADCGSGHALAIRAGVRMVNIDMPYVHAGPKMFMRGGKGTWIGISSTMDGKPVTPYVTGKPSRELGDVTMDVWPSACFDKLRDGTGPVYMNCTDLSEEDHAYMRRAFDSEGIGSIYDYLDQHGIDLRESMVEFGSFNVDLNHCGIEIDCNAETSIKGLYAAGDLTGNVKGSLSGAAAFGVIAGENAAEYVKTAEERDVSGHHEIESRRRIIESIYSRENGAHWKEPASTLQQIMDDYVPASKPRSETLFNAAIKYLGDLRRLSLAELYAENAHELMRCLEILDLIDVGEAVAVAAKFRKESRGLHRRTDYTYTDMTLNNKFLTVKNEGGEFTMEYRARH